MKKLYFEDLFTREEFREQVNEGYFIDSDVMDAILMRMETGLKTCLLPLLRKMKSVVRIWNIHMQYGLINNN